MERIEIRHDGGDQDERIAKCTDTEIAFLQGG